MNKQPKISSVQLKGLIVSTIIGVGILTLPNTLANISGKDGWISIALVGLLLIPFVLMINQIFVKNPGKDYFQIGREALGDIIFTLCMVVFALFLIVVVAFVLRNLGELVKSFLLPTTPIEVVMAILLVTIVYIAVYDIDVIARMGYFLYPILVIVIILLAVIAIPTVKLTNILPVFQSDITKIPNSMMESLFSFFGFEILLFALPYVEDKENCRKSSVMSIVIVTLIYSGLFILTLTQFSIWQIKRQSYPVIMVSKMVDLPGLFLQNLDTVFMSVWIMVGFGTMGPTYFAASKVVENILKTRRRKYIVFALAPIVYIIAVLPRTALEFQDVLGRILDVLGIVSIVIIPFLVYITGMIKRGIKR